MGLLDEDKVIDRRKENKRGLLKVENGDSDSSEEEEFRLASKRRNQFSVYSVFDLKSIHKLFKTNKIKLEHAFKIWRYVVQKGIGDKWDDIPGIPKSAIHLLKECCVLTTSKVVGRQDSCDGSTTKLLIELQDGRRIESVIMRYGQVELSTFPQNLSLTSSTNSTHGKFRSTPRSTLCVSSQVGCSMGCRFCATGTMGLVANLTSGEILEQLYFAIKIEPIRNVVFMGMGEPLDNYNEVIDAIQLMSDTRVFNLSSHRISLSTVGVIPRLKQLQQDAPDISLALSLHAPTQEIREKIVPTARIWNINNILDAAIDFLKVQKQRSERKRKYQVILLEYVLIKGINADVEVAHQLGQFLTRYLELVVLNVIPYNPTISDETMKCPSESEIDVFISVVRSYGIRVLIRQTLGQDISSACGQLIVGNINACHGTVCDLEDLLVSSPIPVDSSTRSNLSMSQNSKSLTIVHGIVQRFINTTLTERLLITTTTVTALGLILYKCSLLVTSNTSQEKIVYS